MRTAQLIQKFPKQSVILIDGSPKEEFNLLSREEKLQKIDYPFSVYVRTKRTDTSVSVALQTLTPKRCGNHFFLKSEFTEEFSIFNNKFSCSDYKLLREIVFPHLKITWLKDLHNEYIKFILKPSLLKSILLGNIYSEETLCKAILRRCYHCKTISWKTFRHYLKHSYLFNYVNIIDLTTFTKNAEESIKVLLKTNDNWLQCDLIKSAIKLDEVVDLTWSQKRLEQEHQRQVRILNLKELQSKSQNPIFDRDFSNLEFKQLNTELDVFQESLDMNHCLYHCYYNKMLKKNYIAFHINNVTLGVCWDREQQAAIIDQIRGRHNETVVGPIWEKCNKFVANSDFQNYFRFLNLK